MAYVPGEAGYSLYDPRFEHDACGVGFVARVKPTPQASCSNLGTYSE